MKKKIGLIGCGFIGTEFATALISRYSDAAELVAVHDIENSHAVRLVDSLKKEIRITSVNELIADADLVVEAASVNIVPTILEQAITLSKDVMIISVGGVIGREDLLESAQEKGINIYFPSGAVGGIDALKSAAVGKIYSVGITTRKPIEGLRGAPYIQEKGIDLDAVHGEQIIFEGKAVDAIKHFPKNVNVSATLSLAGIGPERTNVQIVTSRSYKKNSHEITVEGEFGRMNCLIENVPSPVNPKTSYLASLSCIATLKKILYGVSIGT